MKWTEIWLVMAVLAIMALLFAGCKEAQRTPQVWGQGELPIRFQELFGKSNLARLNFVQTQRADNHQALIYGIDAKDPNGQTVRKRGLIERITALEALEERVKKLEERTVGWRYKEGILHLGGQGVACDVPKPYIYSDPIQRDPNLLVFGGTLDTVCTKHGRLKWGERHVFLGSDKKYCGKCAFDVARIYLDKHIGVDPNTEVVLDPINCWQCTSLPYTGCSIHDPNK